eukprot:scaffold692_cov326-Prasinococcus_capsulatus_cf.AAC.3
MYLVLGHVGGGRDVPRVDMHVAAGCAAMVVVIPLVVSASGRQLGVSLARELVCRLGRATLLCRRLRRLRRRSSGCVLRRDARCGVQVGSLPQMRAQETAAPHVAGAGPTADHPRAPTAA